LLGLTVSLAPVARAFACGGLFCDGPPPDALFSTPPVAQTGENVLFVMDGLPDGQYALEAHIQILYAGPADRFAWVIPVDSLPSVAVSSNRVFQELDAATRPTFQVQWHTEGTCRDQSGLLSTPPVDPVPASRDTSTPSPPPGAAVDVAFRGEVGAYDAAVIRASDATGLRTWLADNRFYVPEEGHRLLATYVAEGKYFVAIRLRPGRDVKAIQPVLLRFAGPAPCVPLRLTAIAALSDLRINLWVLAPSRAVPENFLELEVNPARIDWLDGGRNYDDLLKAAANEAGGNAFAAEYAGPSTSLAGRLHRPGQYDLAALARARTPPDAYDQLAAQGFPRDAQLLALLEEYIPEPQALVQMGVSEPQFYFRLRVYYDQFRQAFGPFDPAAFAAAVDQRIVRPLAQAQHAFDHHRKLTRLATFISPEEMTLDPTFALNPTLGDVPAARTAQAYRVCGARRYDSCTAPVRLELPDGQRVWLERKRTLVGCKEEYDRGSLDAQPALAVAWQRDQQGPGAAQRDNRKAIGDALAEHDLAVSTLAGACSIARAPAAPGCSLGFALVLSALLATRLRRRR
jgi:hypothetical protein